MYDRYGNYIGGRGSIASSLFDTLSPLLRGYMEERRAQKKQNRLTADQRQVLESRYPNLSQEERDKYAGLGAREFNYILSGLGRDQQAEQARQSSLDAARQLGVSEEGLSDLRPGDRDLLIRSRLQDKRLEKRQAQTRKEKKIKELLANGFSEDQARKYVKKENYDQIIKKKGFTPNLKRLANLNKNYIAGKISDDSLQDMEASNPAQYALLTGDYGIGKGISNDVHKEINKFFIDEASRRLSGTKKYLEMHPKLRENKTYRLAAKYASKFGYPMQKVDKLTKEGLQKIKRDELRQQEQAALKAQQDEARRIAAGEMAWQDFGGYDF